MDPPCDSYGVTPPGNAQPSGNRNRVVFRRPHSVHGDGKLKSKPFRSRCGITIPVQARMISQNLNSTADYQYHQRQVEEVGKAQPPRESMSIDDVDVHSARVGPNKVLPRMSLENPCTAYKHGATDY